MRTPDLCVTLGPLTLANPVLVAAGTFGYGLEFQHAVQLQQLGAIVTKTITRAPRSGNPPPRLVETPSGMLNAVGLQNVGLEAFLNEKLPRLRQLNVPLIVSVLGETVEDMHILCASLDAAEGVSAIELNLSCPNLQARSANRPTLTAQDPDATAEMVTAARASTTKPLIAKLSPDVTDPQPVALAAERAGADILALVNTFTGMSIDPRTRASRIGALTGGVSGPAIRPLAVYRVWRVRQAVRCPLIGMGGIVRAEDALEFFIAGASAVAVGTATFAYPAAALRVLRGLTRYLQRQRLASMQDLIGTFRDVAPAAA